MDTTQLETKLYAAFAGNENLVSLLAKGTESIFHIRTPSLKPDYPILVYSTTNDLPELHADNAEFFHSVEVRVHIVTGNSDDYSQIYAEVKQVMVDLGFVRVQSTPFLGEDGTFMLVIDWKIILDDH